MKINGIEVKGIKKAVGDYKRFEHSVIIYDCLTNRVECVPWEGFINCKNEMVGNYTRYIDIVDYIKDIMSTNDITPDMVTIARVKAVLRDYII